MRAWLLIVGLAVILPSITAGKQCDQTKQPAKKIFCYLEGRRSPELLDACKCTHLLVKHVDITPTSQLTLEQGTESDISALRSVNPRLEVMLSLGGDTVSAHTFSSIVQSKESLANLTNSINHLYTMGTIKGLEFDWEWPLSTGDKKDKIKLIRYMRQIKLATGANIPRRSKRSPATTTEEIQDGDYDETTTTSGFPTTTEEPVPETTTADWRVHHQGDDDSGMERIGTSTEMPDDENEATTRFNWRARGAVRRRKKRPTTTPPTSLDSDYEDALTMEDVMFNEAEENVYSVEEQGFVLALRLAPEPFFLVNGYEFKLLNKLMGVSDIQNTDALIDVVQGLGAPVHKLIMTVPAFASAFNLADPARNMPGSAVTGPPVAMTYQKVCQLLSRGNWTLEREEDLTGPYAYLGTKWIAFDDDTSLKIKAKYVLLREMAGIGLMSLDADDLDDVCGKGRASLLTTVHSVLTSLDRKPRQLIVTSLEQANGLRVSPFRIVRIVDREGEIQSIRENSETVLECSRQGYYRHPEDCSRFYRCVKFNQYENDYTIFEYGCPTGLVFDDRWEVCVWPSQATPCDGSSEIFPIPKNDYVCPGEGFFVDPENCRWFFACRDHLGDGTYTHYEFRCPFGLAFDEVNLRCDWPWLVSSCANQGEYAIDPAAAAAVASQGSRRPGGFGGNGGFGGAGNGNGGRRPGGARRPVGGAGLRQPAAAPANTLPVAGQVVSEGCENCYSPVLTITGSGHITEHGIEVGDGLGPIGAGSDTYNTGYNPAPSSPQPAYRPQPTYTTARPQPTYTTARPQPTYTTARPPPPSPTYTTAAPPQAPSVGYNYPVPGTPFVHGISVSNQGELGLKPEPHITPNIPAYGGSTTLAPVTPVVSTTYNPISTTFGSPLPAYGNGISTTYNPSKYEYTEPAKVYRPFISSTYSPIVTTPRPVVTTSYAPPVTTTYGPIAAPAEDYGLPHAPVQTNYEPVEQPAEEYGVPYAPVEDSYEPLPSYGPTTIAPAGPTLKPFVNFGNPSPSYGKPSPSYAPAPAPTPKPSYAPAPQPSYAPEPAYAPAPKPSYAPSPKPSYAPAPAYSYTPEPAPAPSLPSYNYAPEYNYEPVEEYGVPVALAEEYGLPAAPVVSTYEPVAPAEDYGVPLAPVEEAYEPLPAYGPTIAPEPPRYNSPTPKPFVHFGSPSTASAYHEPVETYAPIEEPAEEYGIPLAPVIATTYAPVTVQPIEQGYGVPHGPELSSYESELPSYGNSGHPATLPDNWPQYPGKDLPTPPEISYGGFKPAAYKPEPPVRQPKYQQPSYGKPSRPEISYGGFKGIDAPKPKPGYAYPVPSNPLQYPTTPKPRPPTTPYVPPYRPTTPKAYPTTPVPALHTSVTAAYNPITPFSPVYGSTAAPKITPAPYVPPPAPSASVGYEYPAPANPLEYPSRPVASYAPAPLPSYAPAPPKPTYAPPPPKPTYAAPPPKPTYAPAKPAYSPTTLKPFVDFGSPTVKPGYDYPVPSNPLKYPKGPHGSKPEVASVVTSGFSSATLSNGPFSSLNAIDIDNKPGHLPSYPTYEEELPSYGGAAHENRNGKKAFTAFSPAGQEPRGNRAFGGNNGNTGNSLNRPGAGNRDPADESFFLSSGNAIDNGDRRPGSNAFGAGAGRRPQGNGNSGFGPNGNRGAPANNGFRGPAGNNGFGGPGGNRGAQGNNGFGGPGGNRGAPGNNGFGGPAGNNGFRGPAGNNGFGGPGGNRGAPGNNGFGSNRGNNGFGGSRGNGGSAGNNDFGGSNGNRFGGNGAGNGPTTSSRSPSRFNGNSNDFNGFSNGGNRFAQASRDNEIRTGKELATFTSVTRPVVPKPAVLGKFTKGTNSHHNNNNDGEVNNWDLGIWEKFGPGGFRTFNETLGPEVCERPGLFRHPTDCHQFYECYWDKWIEKFTLHIFPCPVAMAVRQYDDSISACNWPFLGPSCEA